MKISTKTDARIRRVLQLLIDGLFAFLNRAGASASYGLVLSVALDWSWWWSARCVFAALVIVDAVRTVRETDARLSRAPADSARATR